MDRLKSWQMAEAVLKVIENVKKNVPQESDEDMITKFLNSDIAQTFQDHLTRIIEDNKAISSSESPGRSNPGTTAVMRVTLTHLFFMYNDKGAHLFSKDDILAAIRFLNGATNPSDSTQA
ncbi:hypothetical protein IWQ61_010435 [Dispira simplex]|nr:hypothetical protein IWQ61_010435 [Dispira simplex]